MIQLRRSAISAGDDRAGRDDEGRGGSADKSLQVCFFLEPRAHRHTAERMRALASLGNFKASELLEVEV